MSKINKGSKISFNNDFSDQFLYLFSVILGLILILLFRWLDVPALVLLSIPIILIPGYAFIALYSPQFKLPEDRVADNCYYLGFLYTLIALAYALYTFEGSISNRQLISDFGLALGSTIIGILARTLIQQLRVDVDLMEEEVKESLTETATKANAEMQNLITEVKTLTESFKASLKDTVTSANDTVTEFQSSAKDTVTELKKNFKGFSEVSANYKKVYTNTSDRNRDSLEKISNTMESLHVDAENAREKFVHAYEEVLTLIRALKVPVPNNLFGGLETEINEMGTKVSLLNKSIFSLSQTFGDAVDSAVERMQNAEVGFPENTFSKLKTECESLSTTLHNLSSELTDHLEERKNFDEENGEKFVSIANESITELSKSVEELNQMVTKTTEALKKISSGVVVPKPNSKKTGLDKKNIKKELEYKPDEEEVNRRKTLFDAALQLFRRK